MDCVYLLWCFSLCQVFLEHICAAETHEKLSGKLSEYGLIVPFSTDSHGRYISHVVSAGSGSKGAADADAASAFGSSSASGGGRAGSGRRRVARSAPEMPPLLPSTSAQHLFFNVTVFGKELHLRLRANRRLVAPGAFVEWHEDFEEKAKEHIHRNCVFTGDVTDMPEAAVAISNCDGLEFGAALVWVQYFQHPPAGREVKAPKLGAPSAEDVTSQPDI